MIDKYTFGKCTHCNRIKVLKNGVCADCNKNSDKVDIPDIFKNIFGI